MQQSSIKIFSDVAAPHADALAGSKVMRELGARMTKLSSSRSFVVEISSAAIMIIGE